MLKPCGCPPPCEGRAAGVGAALKPRPPAVSAARMCRLVPRCDCGPDASEGTLATLGKVRSGALEQSNVNLTQALVDMIENQRAYEVQANMVKEAKKMDEDSAALMRMDG